MCRQLASLDSSVAVLHLDGYLFPRAERRALRLSAFDLAGYDFVRAAREIRAFILDGDTIHVPPYLASGMWGNPIAIRPAPTVVLDGDLAELCPELRALVDAVAFFITDIETMHVLRADRDVSEGRFSAAEAEERWAVEWPALRDNLLPAANTADLIVQPVLGRRYWIHKQADSLACRFRIGLSV
jgi:hypothetical protein